MKAAGLFVIGLFIFNLTVPFLMDLNVLLGGLDCSKSLLVD